MKRASLATALGVVSLLAAPSHASAQQSATADSIRAQAQRFIAAIASKDIDQFVALFAPEPDFLYVDGGRIYPDRAALKKAGSGFFGGIKPSTPPGSRPRCSLPAPTPASSPV